MGSECGREGEEGEDFPSTPHRASSECPEFRQANAQTGPHIGNDDGVLVEAGNGYFVVREYGHLLFAHNFKTGRLGTEAEHRTGFADMLYASSVSFSDKLKRDFWVWKSADVSASMFN